MGQAPLPPHERPWRHPSELAAAEREAFRTAAVPASTRVFAVVTGTMGMLAIGVLILSATPRRHDSPVAVSATTTPVAVSVPARTAIGPVGIAAIGRLASDDAAADATPGVVRPGLATPIGDGRSALMTRLSTGGAEGDAFDVQLTSGPVVTAAVVDTTSDGLVVVTIAEPDHGAHPIAGALPDDDEMVTILASPPITVPFGQIGDVSAEEGTPVVDADGGLIGLCTRTDDGAMTVVDVTGQGEPGADSTVPTQSTGPSESTEPAQSTVPVSSVVTDVSVVATTVAP